MGKTKYRSVVSLDPIVQPLSFIIFLHEQAVPNIREQERLMHCWLSVSVAYNEVENICQALRDTPPPSSPCPSWLLWGIVDQYSVMTSARGIGSVPPDAHFNLTVFTLSDVALPQLIAGIETLFTARGATGAKVVELQCMWKAG